MQCSAGILVELQSPSPRVPDKPVRDSIRQLCFHKVEDGRLRAALREGKAMGRKEGKAVQELAVPTLDSPWVRLPKLVQGLGPSEVEECGVEE